MQEIDFDLDSVVLEQYQKVICSSVNDITPAQWNIVTNNLKEKNCLAPSISKIKKECVGKFSSRQSNVW